MSQLHALDLVVDPGNVADFVVPANQRWRVVAVAVLAECSVTVGNRQWQAAIVSGGSIVQASSIGAVQPGNTNWFASFLPGGERAGSYSGDSSLVGFDGVLLPEETLRVWDKEDIHAAGDKLTVRFSYEIFPD